MLPQLLTIGALLGAMRLPRRASRSGSRPVDAVGVFWALFFVYSLTHIVRLSWFRNGERARTAAFEFVPPHVPVRPIEPVAERAAAEALRSECVGGPPPRRASRPSHCGGVSRRSTRSSP